jgi:hypothetical protein
MNQTLQSESEKMGITFSKMTMSVLTILTFETRQVLLLTGIQGHRVQSN